MKWIIAALLVSACFGQVTFTRPAVRGTTVPGSCNIPGQQFTDTDGTVGQNVYVCNGSTFDLYTGTGGGSGGSVFTGSTCLNPSFSATPTFSFADVSVKSPTCIQPGAMTANVTSVTFTNKTAGAQTTIAWLQDGTGGRTVDYGASASNTCTVSVTASKTTYQRLMVMADGTTVVGIGCTSDDPADALSGGGLSGASAIDFASIGDGSCLENTFTLTGLAAGDVLSIGLPSTISSGILATGIASATDTAKIRLCNLSGAAVDLASLTYSVTRPTAISASSAINFGSIGDGLCASDTFTLTGAAAGTRITPGYPAALESGLQGTMAATATDTIQVRLCNFSGAAVDPASGTFSAAIL